MNPLHSALSLITENKHTSGAALAFALLVGVAKVGTIWFPAYTEQIKQTTDVLKEIALTYGLLLSGTPATPAPPNP